MKRFLVGVLAGALLICAAAFSGNQRFASLDLQIVPEDRNPWTNLRLNNDPADFQFAIVSDRTGGHRAGIFSQAVEQLNLLQPEFVLSVGDLIEGYTTNADKLAQEWKEFQGYVSKLQMPFFYVPGNHDLANAFEETVWKEKFGRRWYHFIYRDVLFLLLCSDDPPGKEGTIGPQQRDWVQKVLAENRNVRWTIVALHRPIWNSTNVEKNGWLEVEKLLTGRPYTVFAGHVHRYQKFIRNGMCYYQLATTGGGSKLRGIRYGEFDHIVWVTMKRDGPVLANILLDGIYPEDLKKPITDETGVSTTNRRPTYPVRGHVFFEGTPTPHAQVTFYAIDPAKKTTTRTGDAFVDPDGSFVLSSYTANDGAPTGEYAVTVVWRQPWADATGKPGPNQLPERYGKPDTSELRVRVKAEANEFTLELKKEAKAENK
jgi:3',5'-cyclic AMP phosphodiesterase CpdA